MKCRHYGEQLNNTFLDLGSAPPSNSYLTEQTLKEPELWYPLKVLVCDHCWLVQTEDFVGADEMFSDEYAYFSSFSTSWLEHARNYVDEISSRFNIFNKCMVVEVAANDGYLLQYVKQLGIPCYGIEPTNSTAQAAREKGIEIIQSFFGVAQAKDLVRNGRQADLAIANNVLAHVPDINDFVKGFSILLKPGGIATFEFPHLLNLVEYAQFDTIYHEHYSYLSLTAVRRIFEENGLIVFDVDELQTHGGSLRVYAQRVDSDQHPVAKNVADLQIIEDKAGISTIDYYQGFQARAEKIKIDFLSFLVDMRQQGKRVAAYGAAAKGNTMMNFSGLRPDLIAYVADRNPSKHNKYMPGSRIPIVDEGVVNKDKPDFVVVLPWNLEDEVKRQLDYIRAWGGQFVIAVPKLRVV
jgi:SAM-dependent methyltransferase